MDALKELLNNFDPAALLPDLSTLLGRVELVLRIAVLIGPLVLLGLGLAYFLIPAKEANYSFGFRTHRAMASVEAWQFTQRLAGIVWSALGLVLAVVMAVLTGNFRGLALPDMVWQAILCLLWEVAVIALSCLAIWVTVLCLFDRQGTRRGTNPA